MDQSQGYKTIPVSTLVHSIANLLKTRSRMESFLISGELSNVRYVNGHCYFNLKDDQAQIACSLWRSNAHKAGFVLEDGMAVLCHGQVEIYEKRGSLQFNVDTISMAGLGALYLQLQQTKERLEKEGYFASDHKKAKPEIIAKLGIVTGRSTAALQDMLKTLQSRWPMMEVHLFNAPVQGNEAPPKIVQALKKADQAGMDAVILARGGGSFEDLFCFNDESIVKTIYDMNTYVVTGIGHEVDYTLADFAADHRSLTPTGAAQWVSPDQNEQKNQIAMASRQMKQKMQSLFQSYAARLLYLQEASPLANPNAYVQSRQSQLSLAKGRLENWGTLSYHTLQAALKEQVGLLSQGMNRYERARSEQLLALQADLMHNPLPARFRQESSHLKNEKAQLVLFVRHHIASARMTLTSISGMLEALSWQKTLERGFSVVLCDGRPVRSSDQLAAGQSVRLQFAHGSAAAHIDEIEKPVQ